jgi:polar amino acid transport system substrate-binding protein
MAKIQARGRLVVGVDQNTKLFAYRNPRTGELEGFEIELLRDLAAAILGDPNAIEFRTVTTPNRIPAVSDPSTDVDVVASLVTMTCARWQQVLFSSEYYAAAQKVMVRGDATTIQSVADLAGKKVCATAGSTSIQNIAARIPTAKIVAVDSRIDCLVKFQEGTVDAITADDTILAGFQEQDSRATKILDESLEPEPYGMIFRNDHADLVRFTNALLDQMRADGRLAQLGQTWLGAEAAPVPPARYQP